MTDNVSIKVAHRYAFEPSVATVMLWKYPAGIQKNKFIPFYNQKFFAKPRKTCCFVIFFDLIFLPSPSR